MTLGVYVMVSLLGNLSLVGASSLLQLESQQCILTQNAPMLILSPHSTVVSSTRLLEGGRFARWFEEGR